MENKLHSIYPIQAELMHATHCALWSFWFMGFRLSFGPRYPDLMQSGLIVSHDLKYKAMLTPDVLIWTSVWEVSPPVQNSIVSYVWTFLLPLN